MLRNGALPGRDSCDFSPKSDDSTKNCVKLSLADATAEVPSFRSESYGVPITFSSPRSREALLDLMVATIQAKDLRTCSTLVICQQNAEARHVKSEMGKRNINTMLLDADHLTTHNLVRLWSQGYIHQVLIACDDHLNLLEGICVNFVIHTALPPVEKFKHRLNMLANFEKCKAEMLAFISDGRNVKNRPEIGNAFGMEQNDKPPQLVPIIDNLKENLPEEPEPEEWKTPPEQNDKPPQLVPLIDNLKENLPEEPEPEEWKTQPEENDKPPRLVPLIDNLKENLPEEPELEEWETPPEQNDKPPQLVPLIDNLKENLPEEPEPEKWETRLNMLSESPSSDDSTKKCVKLSLADETAEVVPSFRSESYGVPITFSSPRSREALLDLMVATIQTKDLRTCSILVICQQNAEAQHVKSEMGKRNINTMLLDADDLTTHNLVRLWSQGYIHQVLIACDDHLNLLEGICVDFVIHTALPPVEKFKHRLNMLANFEKCKAEMLAFISDGPNVKNRPEIGNAFGMEQNDKPIQLVPIIDNLKENLPEEPEPEEWETPLSDGPQEETRSLPTQPEIGNAFDKEKLVEKLVVKPLNDNLEKASADACSARALIRENGTANESLSEESECEEWEASSVETVIFNGGRCSADAWSARALIRESGSANESLSEESEYEECAGSSVETVIFNAGSLQSHMYNIAHLTPSVSGSRPSSQDSVAATKSQSSTAAAAAAAFVLASKEFGITRTQFGVMAWSRELIVPCFGISGVAELNPSIRDAMLTLIEDMKDRKARGLQRFAWPHVSCGKSLVAVGPEKVGKTWCFVPSLCQRTHEQMLLRSENLYGPTSILVSFNKQQGKQILHWITKLLDPLNTENRSPYKQVVTLLEKGKVKEVAESLRQPVGVLLTTPDMLVLLKELHTKENPIFHANSIKCLALDNLSDMMRYMPDITGKMIDWIINLLNFGADACQLFVTTRLWSEILMRERLLHLLPDALVVFKDPLEATIYWKSSLEVNLIEPGEQIHSLIEMLQDEGLKDKRIVVMCHTKVETLQLKQNLSWADIRAEAIYDDGCLSTVKQWRLKKLTAVLLISDDVVNKVNCGPIDQIIHYTSAISWMRFKFRFSLLYNNYTSSWGGGSPSKTVVLLLQSDFQNLWLLSEFVMWHHLPRPNHWLRVMAKIRQLRDIPCLELAKSPLCEHIGAYGECFRRTCRYRHVMWNEEVQPPSNYPTEGDFSFYVLTCNSPTQIAVRLYKLYPTKCTIHNTPMTQLGHEIHKHYEIEENRHHHLYPKVDDIVIVRNLKRYERVVITGISVRGITVRLLDTGMETLTYKRRQIFTCEKRHKIEPGQAMEVRVIGIEPDTLDRIWTQDLRDGMRTSFFSRLPEKRMRIFSASVKYVLSRTIFVETVFDDKGEDLRSILLGRSHVHEDFSSMEKLEGIAKASQPRPKEP